MSLTSVVNAICSLSGELIVSEQCHQSLVTGTLCLDSSLSRVHVDTGQVKKAKDQFVSQSLPII